jgi:hypothetical protein
MAGVLATELAALELRARRAPVVAVGFVFLIALFARLAGFRLTDWGPYTKHILDSLSGYAESFSQAESLPLALLLISSVAAIIALDACRVRRCPERVAAVVRWIAVALLLWMSVKGALVRHDGPHWIRAIGTLAAFVAIYIVVHRREWGPWMRVASAVPAMALGVAFFLATVDAVPRISLERQMNRVGTFFRDGAAFPAAKDAEARVAMEAEIRRSSLADGSVGVFGTWHSLLLGYSGPHVALPVVASYEIWSPWTSRREQEFLLGPEAPDYLLYTASPVSAEVAVTLARRYEEIERRPRYLLLRRRPQSLAVNKRVVFDATVDDRRAIAIPAEWRTGPAVAEVRYTKTLANTVISTIHQPPKPFSCCPARPATSRRSG